MSTKNTKLPRVSNIFFCSSAGKNMDTLAFTGESGVVGTLKVCFKQPNKPKYPYQIQYRVRYMYNERNQVIKGSEWTAWGEWKAALAGTNLPVNSNKSINSWNVANKKTNSKSSYVYAADLTSTAIGSDYMGIQWQYRIRTYNAAKKQHGELTTQTLSLYNRTAITNESATMATDGGLDIHFHYANALGGSVFVRSIKDITGAEILLQPMQLMFKTDSYPMSTPASGYKAGKLSIGRQYLAKPVQTGMGLITNIYYANDTGAQTKFSLSSVSPWDLNVQDFTLTHSLIDDYGMVECRMLRQDDNDMIASADCVIKYTDIAGEEQTLRSQVKEVNASAIGKTCGIWLFAPPMGIPLTIVGTIKDHYGRTLTKKIEGVRVGKSQYLLTSCAEKDSMFYIDGNGEVHKYDGANNNVVYLAAWANPEWNIRTSNSSNINLTSPIGKKNQWATFTKGPVEQVITFKADIFDQEDINTGIGGSAAMLAAWKSLEKKLDNWFVFRTPYGDAYNVIISDYNLDRTAPHVYTAQLTMTVVEVD